MKRIITLSMILCFLAISNSFSDEGRLLRFPNASKTQIAFCHGGDIYVVARSGGMARKITNGEGEEMFPRFSNDGTQIAFSAEYDGNRELYTMPSDGGEPNRLTYSMDLSHLPDRMGPDKIVMQWLDNDNSILYRSRKNQWNSFCGNLYKISAKGGLPEILPLPRAGFGTYSPDGTKIAYNRIFREFRTWKRYRGGQADDIWIYDFKTKKIENITNNPAQDIIPMWAGNKIYYLSDRDHTMNLFVYDLTTKETKKLTNFDKYDCKFPSLGVDNITFENGGYIYVLDLATDIAKKVDIQLSEDFITARQKITDIKGSINGIGLSPDGSSALLTARGDVFTVPSEKEKAFTKNLTKSSGVHDRNANWSPDGKLIAFISDKSGEFEIYTMKPDGSEVTQLTNDAKSYRFDIMWSPDSKKIICSDKSNNLYYVNVDTKAVTNITKSKIFEITNYKWSPDSKWIAYTDFLGNERPVIFLYSIESKQITQVTDIFFASTEPEFSQDGKYLFFLSDRTFDPKVNQVEWNFSIENMTKIYGYTLQNNLESPFTMTLSDNKKDAEEKSEATNDKKSKKDKKNKKDEEKTETPEVKDIQIDLDGITDRVFELPVPNSDYSRLVSIKNKLYYPRGGALYAFNFDTKKEDKVGDFSFFDVSANGKKIIYRKDMNLYVSDITDDIKPKDDNKLNLEDLKVTLNKKEEWKQVFNEAWRQMRDFFYDPNMHGVDWKAMHDKYAELLPYVVNRGDLTFVIGEMIGELNCGHSYVGGGETPNIQKVPVGLLGAEFQLDKASGFYKITKIFKGRNWEEKTRSPLTEPGIDVKVGDYLIAIDGDNLTAEYHPYVVLNDKANKYVTLKVNSKPSVNGAKDYIVKTISSEAGLIYYNWVEGNRQKVEKATNGKVAYIHVPDMGFDNGLVEFIKQFYPQTRKDAVIIDDRYNGGGNVSPIIIERLRRVLALAEHARNQDVIMTKPDQMIAGPMCCLINEQSASDGDLFPYEFHTLGLGKVIGKRSWGGVIGIRGSLPFLDGSYMTKPEFANFGRDGQWVLEGVGMQPDIVVDNDPAKEWEGIDEQLDKGIEVILDEMKTDTRPKVPTLPPFPDKSK